MHTQSEVSIYFYKVADPILVLSDLAPPSFPLLPQPFGVTPTALNISLPSVWKQQTKGYEIHVLPFLSCV